MYVSPLKRTVQTAEAVSKFVNFTFMKTEKNLIEQNFGDWAGKKISDVWQELDHNKNKHNFSFTCPETCPPNGDSYLDQCKRAARYIDKFNFEDKKSVVFITHSGMIKAILAHILDIDPDKSMSIEISYLSLTFIDVIKKKYHKNRGGRFLILGLNHQIL